MAAKAVFTSPVATCVSPPAARPRPSPAVPAQLSVIIVNYRRLDQTTQLVRQLDRSDCIRSSQAQVILVDNDDNPRPLREQLRARPGVTIRSFGRNRGFARAVNEGCRVSASDWILLLNPDVCVAEEFLDRVLIAAEQLSQRDPRAGVIGFELRHSDGSPQASTGPFPTLWNVLTGLARPRDRRRCRLNGNDQSRPVDWATGCCLLIRRDCWEELGGFDEDFFLYYEDVDFCRRARLRGCSVWFEPAVRITHAEPLHQRRLSSSLRLITRHALLTYAAKHWPNWQWRFLGRIVALEARLRAWWARRRGNLSAFANYGRLSQLTADLLNQRHLRARRFVLQSASTLVADTFSDAVP